MRRVGSAVLACEEQVEWSELCGCWKVVAESSGGLWLLAVDSGGVSTGSYERYVFVVRL